jgi:hypothetical protein
MNLGTTRSYAAGVGEVHMVVPNSRDLAHCVLTKNPWIRGLLAA